MERPQTPRGYEVIGLRSDNIQSIVRSLFTLAAVEGLSRNARFMKCVLIYISYVAAENIPGAEMILFENKVNLGGIINKSFEEMGASRELVIMVCKAD